MTKSNPTFASVKQYTDEMESARVEAQKAARELQAKNKAKLGKKGSGMQKTPKPQASKTQLQSARSGSRRSTFTVDASELSKVLSKKADASGPASNSSGFLKKAASFGSSLMPKVLSQKKPVKPASKQQQPIHRAATCPTAGRSRRRRSTFTVDELANNDAGNTASRLFGLAPIDEAKSGENSADSEAESEEEVGLWV